VGAHTEIPKHGPLQGRDVVVKGVECSPINAANHTHTLSLSLALSLSLSLTHTHPLSRSLSLTHALSRLQGRDVVVKGVECSPINSANHGKLVHLACDVYAPRPPTSSSLLLSRLELSDTKSMSLKHEPSSEPLHISAKSWFVRLWFSVQGGWGLPINSDNHGKLVHLACDVYAPHPGHEIGCVGRVTGWS